MNELTGNLRSIERGIQTFQPIALATISRADGRSIAATRRGETTS
ncbi:hypothetical protein [Paraburkholderia megapolitana]|nr:hypothetical protein [Paraburkholderia megapolitana]